MGLDRIEDQNTVQRHEIMENGSILSVLDNLHSTKTKERNAALDELTSTLKQTPDLIPTKTLASTCETLVELLDDEHRKYCNLLATVNDSSVGKMSLSENRLSSAAYVLRLFVEKTCSRFKLKTLRLLPAVLPELMVKQNSKSLLEPISVHLTFALYALINSRIFQLKLALHQWVSLTETICHYLEERLDVSLVDRNISNFISILDSLLSIDCVGLSQVSQTIHRTLMKYLQRIKKQDTNTRLVISVISQLTLKTHCFNIMDTLRLIKETWRQLIVIDVAMNEPIQNELSYLDIYASDLIFNNIPSMIGNEEAEFESYEISLISTCREYLITRLTGFKSSTLSIAGVKFSSNLSEKVSFFEFDDFKLKESADIYPWLRIMSITKLLISYFKLLQRNSVERQLFKRRKCESNLPSILRNSQTLSSFLCDSLASGNNEVEIVSLQITAFAAAMHDIDGNDLADLLEVIMSKFENVGLTKWVCFALIPIFTQKDLVVTDEGVNRIFKLCLPLIKQPEFCSVSCALLTVAMKHSNCEMSDMTTISQVSSIYELSDVNGPSSPCNEAFVFWESLQIHGAELGSLSLKAISSKVVDWLKSKWDLLIVPQEDHDRFYEFLAWLCDRKRFGARLTAQVKNFRTYNWKGSWRERYCRWIDQHETRSFILQEEAMYKSIKECSKIERFGSIIVERIVIGDILYRLLELIEGENGLNSVSKFKWVCQVLKLAAYLAGDSNYLNYLLDFKRAASTAVNSIRFTDKNQYKSFFEDVSSLEVPPVIHLVFEGLPMNRIINEFKQLVNQDYEKNHSDQPRILPSIDGEISITEAYASSNITGQSILALSVKALLHVLQNKEAGSSLENWEFLLTYVDNFGTENFILCLPPITSWVASEYQKWPSDGHYLERFTEILSDHLLQGDFSTSSVAVYHVCSYLAAIRNAWLETVDSPLNADCNDILDWIILRFEDTAFCGRLAVKGFSKLLLLMLRYHDLSRGYVNGGKQRIFAAFSRSLRTLDILDVVSELRTVAEYMVNLSHKNQCILFSEISALLDTPQQSIEMSAMYALGMFKISSTSHTNLILTVKDVIHYTGFQHTRVYITSAIKKMASHLGLTDVLQVFNICSYDIIAQWLDNSSNKNKNLSDVCDIVVFGFKDLPQFFRLYTAELVAMYFARSPNNSSILSELVKMAGRSKRQLFLDYYHLIVPLSFVTGGIGEAIYDVAQNLTGNSFLKTQSQLLLYRWVLRFLDLGSNYETGTIIESFRPQNLRVKELYISHPNELRYQYPLHIPLATGMGLLRQMSERHSFCKEDLHFLLMWILSDLTNSLDLLDKLRCIRQIKFILAINEEVLASITFVPNLLPPLCSYLAESKLHNEISDIIVVLLHISRDNKLDIADELLQLFSHVLMMKRGLCEEVSRSLKEELKQTTNCAGRFKRTLRYCNDAIESMTLSTEVYMNNEILETESCNKNSILLLSLLFDCAQKPYHIVFDEQPSMLSVQNLLKFEVPKDVASENFQLWLAYYLSAFNETNYARLLDTKRDIYLASNYDKLFNNFGSLECLIDNYLAIEERSLLLESCSVKFFCQTLTALFLNNPKYEDEKALVIKKMIPPEKCGNDCLLITDHVFSSIHNQPEKSMSDMQHFLRNVFLIEKIPYFEWLIQFNTALLHHVTQSVPNCNLFRPLLSKSNSFAQNALPILFNLLICYDHKTAFEWIPDLFTYMLELLKCDDSHEKIKSCLCIVNMLMTGKRLEERRSTSCFSRLPLKIICEAAIKSGQITFAYMVYEMLYMTEASHLDIELLRTIYESLGDVDLLSGLPAPHSLIGALHFVSEIEPKTQKNFMFNNAVLDAQFPASDFIQRSSLLKATEYQGYYGIANCLSKEQPLSKNIAYDYKWALQLSRWDLPTPQRIDSKEKSLYLTLKKISYDAPHPSKTIQDSLVQVVECKNDFETPSEWVETIAEMALLKELSDCMSNPENLVATLRKTIDFDRRALYVHDFSDYKSNIQSRYMLSKLLLNRSDEFPSISSADLTICTGALLANYVQLAVQEKCPQDALKNAVLLDSLESEGNSSVKLERLRSYVSAIALWECNDVKTPVLIMKDLFNDKSNNAVAERSLNELTEVSNDEVQALLVKWSSKSRIETPSTIYENYVNHFEASIKSHDSRAEVFYIMADFLDGQVKRLRDQGEIEERQKRCEKGSEELQSLATIYMNTNVPDNERRDAKRHHGRVALQLSSDKEILNNLLVQRVQFVWRALHYFINTMVFTNKYDNDVLDKFCGLWFEHDGDDSVNSLLRKEIGMIPSWKFLPWVNQISSKLSVEETEFQKPLQLTMKRLLFKLPYHSLYSVLSMKLYERHSFTTDSIIPQKIKAVDKILNELQGYDSGSYHRTYVVPLQDFCGMSVDLANTQPPKSATSSKKIHLKNVRMGEYWLSQLPNQKIPLPTIKWKIKSSNDGKAPVSYIASVDETVDISTTGLSLPKIVTFTLSDGSRHKVLMKGSNDDLRQDAIMEQVFQQVNDVLQHDKQMRKLDLNISTYTVIPLGPRAGIIEYVTNSLSLHQILSVLHKNDPVSFNQARKEMKSVQTRSNNERLQTYIKLTQEIKPQLRNFFFDSFPNSDDWFNAKKTYTKGIATTSVVGYILGLGDRHLNNILLDHHTGKPTHIDLGIAFDQGRLLPIPEMVPFRLTRDIVNGFGVTGVEGLFRRSCEHTYAVLRENYEKVMHVLNILKWDPLYSWVMSPIKKHKHLLETESQDYSNVAFGSEGSKTESKETEQNQQSYRALKGVEEKLIRNGLSVEATIQELIQQASDPRNLSVIYMGWSPFY